MYQVKELYYTLQGEGRQVGRPAVFCRFSGCNLWTGHEEQRSSVVCQFCDTDFVGIDGPGGGRYTTESLVAAALATWRGGAHQRAQPYIVCTGGEPSLQLDEALTAAFHTAGFAVGIETNGTRPLCAGIDWVCVSPKAGAPLVVTTGDELKLVYPQDGASPAMFEDLPFTHHLLQPMDGPDVRRHTEQAIAYCLAHPQWHLSVQTHKMIGIA